MGKVIKKYTVLVIVILGVIYLVNTLRPLGAVVHQPGA